MIPPSQQEQQVLGGCKADPSPRLMEQQKESEEILLRSACDGSMSSIGSCPVDLSSPKDVHQLCYAAPRRINQLLDDESAAGLRIRSPRTPVARNGSCGNLISLEDRVHADSRVKFMCSFGGRILPRPSDGKLRYVGGETRIVSVNRDVTFAEIMVKLCELCDQTVLLKYQMPDEDLDALVSVCNDEDLENMLEEYDRLEMSELSSRLRAFLFPGAIPSEELVEELERTDASDSASKSRSYLYPVSEYDMDCFFDAGEGNLEQQYIDAVNGVAELSLRKDSGVSVSNSVGVDHTSVGSYQGDSLEISSMMMMPSSSRAGPPSISSASPSTLSPQMSSWISSGQCHDSTESERFEVSPQDHHHHQQQQQLKRYAPDFPEQSQKADILQLYPPKLPEIDTSRQALSDEAFHHHQQQLQQQQQQQQIQSSLVHDESLYGASPGVPYIQHAPPFSNVAPGHHLCHAIPPYHHIPPSPSCNFGFPRRCMCGGAFTQFQVLRPGPSFSAQQYVRPVHDFYGGFHGSHPPCCCEHPPDVRPVWWRHCQSCVHYDLLLQQQQSQLLSKPPPGGDPGSPMAAAAGAFLNSAQRLEQQQATAGVFGLYHGTVENSPQGSEPDGRFFSDSPPSRAVSTGSKAPPNQLGFAGKEPEIITSSAAGREKESQPESVVEVSGSSAPQEPERTLDLLLVSGSSGVEVQTKAVETEVSAAKPLVDPGASASTAAAQLSTLVFSTAATRVVKGPAMKSLLSTSIHQASSAVNSSSPGPATEVLVQDKIVDLKKSTVAVAVAVDSEPKRSPTLRIWENEDDSKRKLPGLNSLRDEFSADADDDQENNALRAESEAVSRGLQTIRNGDLEEIRQLGSGTFGTVFYGKWRGSEVAIKRIKPSCFAGRPSERDRLIADFWREAYTLSQLHHPNVVAFYGVVPDSPEGTLATVTEYMVNGSLKQVLHRKDRTIDRRKRLLIAMDAAIGMEYLHEKKIVHFDLKCENLLVNMRDPHRPICKVGDFGLSKVKHRTMVSGGVRGTLPWMAPELLNGSSSMVTEKVDIFSFGIVMWELLTGEEPYANMHYGAIIGGIVSNTLRPTIPDWCDPSWKSLMERCWAADPAERPSFSNVAADLRAMTATPLQPKTQTQTQTSSGAQAC